MIVAVNGRKPRVAGHWKRVINAGYAASVLNREVQDELEQLVQELGYELVRVKGFLMMICAYFGGIVVGRDSVLLELY